MTSDNAFRHSMGTRVARIAGSLVVVMLLTSGGTAGAQWFYQHPVPQPNTLRDVDCADGTLVCMAVDGDNVFRSDDGGVTWGFVGGPWGAGSPSGTRFLIGISLSDEHTATVAVSSIGGADGRGAVVYQTTDGGVTWTRQVSGNDVPNAILTDVDFDGANDGIAVGIGVVTLWTSDGGATWTPAPVPDLGALPILQGVSLSNTGTGIAVGAVQDPDSGTSGGLILRTTDGGQTWTDRLRNTDEVELRSAAFTGSNWIVVGSHGTVFTSSDDGESWVQRDSGTDRLLQDVTCLDGLSCIAVGGGPGGWGPVQGRVALRTADGGESWTTLILEDETSSLNAVASYDPAAVVTVGSDAFDIDDNYTDGGVILRSTDGGDSWQKRNRGGTRAILQSVSFTDADTGTAVGQEGTILRTTDGGNTWVRQESGTTLLLEDVTFIDDAIGLAVGGAPADNPSSGVILKTTDGGASWSPRILENEQGHQIAFGGVFCTDSDHCTAVGRGGDATDGYVVVIVRTEDGGDSWVVKYRGSPTPFDGRGFNDVHCTDSLRCIVVGNDGFGGVDSPVLRTVDGGETWTETAIEEISNLRAVSFVSEQIGTAVGRRGLNGFALRTTDGGASWITVLETGDHQPLYDVSFIGDNGVIVGEAGMIFRTSDGGETWTQDKTAPYPGGTGQWMAVAIPEQNVAVAVGGDGGHGHILRAPGTPTFPLVPGPDDTTVCIPEESSIEVVDVLVGVGSVGGYEGTVTLSTSGEPLGITSDLEPNVVDVPGTAATWTMTLDGSVPAGPHLITLSATDGTQQQHVNFRLSVTDPEVFPQLVLPLDGAAGVATLPTFTWLPISEVNAYRLQVATDSAFQEIVIDTEVAETGFTPTDELETDTQYFWRVQGLVPEAQGCPLAWSAGHSFVTESVPVAEVMPEGIELEVPPGGGGSATLHVANAGTGELVWAVQAAQSATVAGGRSAGGGPALATTADPARAKREGGDAALDLASVLGEPLAGLRPIPPAAGLGNCSSEPGLIVHDDGTIEDGYGGNPDVVSLVAFVDRFTPNAYPAALTSVCVALVTTGPTALDLEIVVYDDDGPSGAPGTELGTRSVSVEGLPTDSQDPRWFRFDLSSLGISIDSGSAYVGVRWVPAFPGVFVAADESPDRPSGFAGGYWWNNATDAWAPTESTGGFEDYRSLFIRTVAIPGGCDDPSTVPWLSYTPDAGITPAGGTTPVEITVGATGLAVGEYAASLCVFSNDTENSILTVPISLTVVGSELTLDRQSLDFGDVFVDASSDPQDVTLHNTGSLDATGLGFQVAGSGFEVDAGTCGATLGAGESCQVNVTFAPIESGPAEGTLEVTSETGLPVVLVLAGNGVRETEVFTPIGLEVDAEAIVSDANGVFEPGELVPVAPVWRHDGVATQDLTGTASDLTGPEGPTYELQVADAVYGLVEPGVLTSCQESASCYQMAVGPTGVVRPTLHWDAAFDEILSDDTSHTWTLHIGDSFTDVPRESPFYGSIEALLHDGVTGGCSDSAYCPGGVSSRAQMPVFVLRALEGPGYQPPACSVGAPTFADVPIDSPFCPWIKELVVRGVVSGCGGDNYCPNAPVTRAQMAIFLLRTLEGAGYTPPDCAGEFTDVTCPSPFAAWVEELARRGVTSGCSGTEFCPSAPVTRAQMATFIVRTFGLELYGP